MIGPLKTTRIYDLGPLQVRFAFRWASFLVGFEYDVRDRSLVLCLGPFAARVAR